MYPFGIPIVHCVFSKEDNREILVFGLHCMLTSIIIIILSLVVERLIPGIVNLLAS